MAVSEDFTDFSYNSLNKNFAMRKSMRFPPMTLSSVENSWLVFAHQQWIAFMDLLVRYAPECPESANRHGIKPHGCTGAGLSLFFLSWVARSHALQQCLRCWNIKNKTRVFSLISTGTNHLYLSDCKAFSGKINLESSETRAKTPLSKKQHSGKSQYGEICPPLSYGVSPVARLCN